MPTSFKKQKDLKNKKPSVFAGDYPPSCIFEWTCYVCIWPMHQPETLCHQWHHTWDQVLQTKRQSEILSVNND